MYDVMGIGTRIAAKRRMLGLTQEKLAEKLGISAQAVSKWETGLGYPDLTLLPHIAAVLDTSIDGLFGREVTDNRLGPASTIEPASVFPATYEDLPLITIYRRCALYAEAIPDTIDGHLVRFSDGSEADLGSHTVVNRGSERMLIVCEDDLVAEVEPEPESETKEEPLNHGYQRYHFDLNGRTNVQIVRAETGEKGGWKADGSPAFMQGLAIDTTGDTFSVKLDAKEPVLRFHIFGNKWRNQVGKITVFVPSDRIEELDVRVRGAVELSSTIDMDRSRIEVNGGCTLQLPDVGDTSMHVHGAGTLRCQRAKNAEFTINGAGTVKVAEISGDVTCKLAGAGTIKMAGEIDAMTVKMSGAGELKAKDVSVERLEIDLTGASHATIGRVRGQSIERISHVSSLSIDQRG